jgi:type I restriction enzyme R subunit
MEDEKTTRGEIIDQRLKVAGWNVSDPTQVVQELFISAKLAAEEGDGVLHDPAAP